MDDKYSACALVLPVHVPVYMTKKPIVNQCNILLLTGFGWVFHKQVSKISCGIRCPRLHGGIAVTNATPSSRCLDYNELGLNESRYWYAQSNAKATSRTNHLSSSV
eukprot:scpid39830/ scgid15983/ 